ncbi:MAG: hypothetical protein H6733_07765 [Alphaproteobacteria bacterium]|nr:hypothetical protein [Alphaproteobacteria bacterium]
MSASNFDAKVGAAIDAVKGRKLPGMVSMLAYAGIAWGVLALGAGLTMDWSWTWGAYLSAVFWIMCLAQGGFVFAAILQGTQARWGRPLKRIGEAFALFLPVAWVLLLVFLLGGINIYPWNPNFVGGDPVSLAPHGTAPASKELWLSTGFFIVRQLGGGLFLFGLSLAFVRNSMRGDILAMRARLGTDAPSPWWHNAIVGSATDAKAAAEVGLARNYTLVPILAFSYALIWSMFAFDLVMSLDPWWFSNMFGGWIFMSTVLLGMGGIALFALLGRDWLGLGAWLKPNVTHDLGKLMLAGTMFWGYTLFAQLLPIYYTDVPEETGFLMVRLMLPEWSWLARLVAMLVFITPFTMLLSRGLKKMRYPFVGLALLSMTGLFLERTLLVMPSVHFGATFPTGMFLAINLGLWAGVIGAFVLVVGKVLSSVPAVPVTDPLLDEHPWDQHVHAIGAHGHH